LILGQILMESDSKKSRTFCHVHKTKSIGNLYSCLFTYYKITKSCINLKLVLVMHVAWLHISVFIYFLPNGSKTFWMNDTRTCELVLNDFLQSLSFPPTTALEFEPAHRKQCLYSRNSLTFNHIYYFEYKSSKNCLATIETRNKLHC
jgi:hypothetical protein